MPQDHFLRCSPCGVTTFVFVRSIHSASEPAKQPACQLRRDFLNFWSCSKTVSLFIVFFIKFAFLAQKAGWILSHRSKRLGRGFRPEPLKTLQYASGRFRTLQDASERPRTLQHVPGRFRTLQDASGRFRTPQDASGRSGTPRDASGRLRTLQDASGRRPAKLPLHAYAQARAKAPDLESAHEFCFVGTMFELMVHEGSRTQQAARISA